MCFNCLFFYFGNRRVTYYRKISGYVILFWHFASSVWVHLSPVWEESLQSNTVSIKRVLIFYFKSTRYSNCNIFIPSWNITLLMKVVSFQVTPPLSQRMRVDWMDWWVWKSYAVAFTVTKSHLQTFKPSTELHHHHKTTNYRLRYSSRDIGRLDAKVHWSCTNASWWQHFTKNTLSIFFFL